MWVGMVQEESGKAPGAWMEEKPQNSGEPETHFSLCHSLGLGYDGG